MKLCQLAFDSLKQNYEKAGQAAVALAGLSELMKEYDDISPKMLKKSVWTTAESGSIGLLLNLGTCRSRQDPIQQQAIAVFISREADGRIVCACTGPETCHGAGGCTFDKDVDYALGRIRSAMAVTMSELFLVLSSTLRRAGLERGAAVTYGKDLSLVRIGSGSWPYVVVRKGKSGQWLCVSCFAGNTLCGHVTAAEMGVSAKDAREEVDEGFDPAEGMEVEQDECGRDDEPPAPEPLVNRFRWHSRSFRPRHLVPPDVAQRRRQALVAQAAAGGPPRVYKAPATCRFCGSGAGERPRLKRNRCRIEFEDGAVDAIVETWRCPKCRFKVMCDGKEDGTIFHSSCTGYAEAFLFELSVNISRNGTAMKSVAELREGYLELSGRHKWRPQALELRSVSTLRKAAMLYVELVLEGLPLDVSTCARCRSPDGSFSILCFDGLQLGFHVKHKKPFVRIGVRTRSIPRASTYAHLVRDGALSKALGSVLTVSGSGPTVNSKTVSTLTAMRGHVMAVSALLGGVNVGGVAKTFPGPKDGGKGKTLARGWCPLVDGNASPAVLSFLRRVFCCDGAARPLCLAVASGTADFRRRVPRPLLARINEVVLGDQMSGPAVDATEAVAADPVAGRVDSRPKGVSSSPETMLGSMEADMLGCTTDDDATDASDGDSSSSVDSDDTDSGCNILKRRKVNVLAPLASYAEALSEPALADTGGVSGILSESQMFLRLQPDLPTTVVASHKVIHFARALVVDPVTIWSSGKDLSVMDRVRVSLEREDFNEDVLSNVLDDAAVCELRLLRGAIACLGPALLEDRSLRKILADVLASVKATKAAYEKFISTSTSAPRMAAAGENDVQADGLDDGVQQYNAEAMARCHQSQTFTPQQFTDTWLLPPASPERYRAAYGLGPPTFADVLKEGLWAPSLPAVRPAPSFVGTAAEALDVPTCSHLMGREKAFTAGTFGAFCTCSHPKCVGVVVLHNSESQRMPIEFMVQRCRTLPRRIVYDFACAALKTALCRLPEVALTVAFSVDRFHWRKNHVDCSYAMNPDSYESMEAINTSSSEERNALARRQQYILRKMTQDNFIKMMVYQQVISNVIAMYKDQRTVLTLRKWPLWYRNKYVDGAPDVVAMASTAMV